MLTVRHRPTVSLAYVAAAGAAFVVFAVGAVLLSITIPYHDWDSFAFGAWSKQIAGGGSLDPLAAGQLGSGRPLFYLLQGALWSVTGVSFSAGRLLSLGFVVVLVAAVAAVAFELASDAERRRLQAAVAALCMLAVPALAQESIAGKTDVPAATLVAVAAAIALRRRERTSEAALLALAALAATLTKPTVIAPLVGLGAWLLFERSRPLERRLRWSVGPLALGLLAGFVYDGVMALRFHTGLVAYLRTGTSEGLWAQRAAADRWHALLRLDVFGAGLRLPLAFALLYCVVRSVGVAHRRASTIALVLGLVWAVVGPIAAGVPGGAFATAEAGFTLVGFTAILAGTVLTPDVAPSRAQVAVLGAIGIPPLALWLYATAYFDRLAATAWPGLVALIAISVCLGIRGLGRLGATSALAPIPILAVAVWIAVATLDGFHGPDWSEYRSLGIAGARDKARTMNIVLPSLQSAIATAAPYLKTGGRMSVSDPRFEWFLPGEVDTTTALHCNDVSGYSVFVLLTSDESEEAAREDRGLATPEEWARCSSPHLRQLSDGSNGYAVFAVRS